MTRKSGNSHGSVIQINTSKLELTARKDGDIICHRAHEGQQHPTRKGKAEGKVQEIEDGTLLRSNSWTLKDYSSHYFELRKTAGVIAPGSIRRDRDKMASLNFLIGNVKLQKLTPTVLETAYIDLRNGKSKSGKKLSGTYVYEINKVLSCMLKDAVTKNVMGSR